MKKPGRWIALVGFILLIVWSSIFHMTRIDAALGFSFLVLVPLLVEEVVKHQENRAEQWLRAVMQTSLPFAGAGVISVTMPPGQEAGWWAFVWFFYTLMLAFGGLMRLAGRGVRPLEETVIDVGLLYIAVGGAWLVISQSGWASFLPYTQTIVQLTAIHFHYAAFVLPLATGFFGRFRSAGNRVRKQYTERPYHVLCIGVLIGPFLVAIGLDQGPPVEVVTVGLYVLILIWLAVWWFWLSVELPSWGSSAIRLASLLLVGTMILSFAYSWGLMSEAFGVSIGQMVSYHDLVNAFGFSILVTLAWRKASPPQRHPFTTFPVSNLRQRGYVGNDAIYRNGWAETYRREEGLVPTWKVFRSHHFDPTHVHPDIRKFYLRTDQFTMEADVRWEKRFQAFSKLSCRVTRKFGQINLPLTGRMNMSGEIVSISDKQDGREQVRAWVRKNEKTDEPVFTALYSYHKRASETYMNISLPLPLGTMTGILRPEHDGREGLVLTSHLRPDSRGDEGVYLTFGSWTIRTPLREWFHVSVRDGDLAARHQLAVWGIKFLTIDYILKEKEPTP
ncbi:YndJ family protein [Halobacillus salinus]|uniref:YndJ family protein n=1 Tax=Halobacillus salinus TaxID=192814 RepID=UPI0009A63EBB|nr:YndJ family protein [Halobacillus salinus]